MHSNIYFICAVISLGIFLAIYLIRRAVCDPRKARKARKARQARQDRDRPGSSWAFDSTDWVVLLLVSATYLLMLGVCSCYQSYRPRRTILQYSSPSRGYLQSSSPSRGYLQSSSPGLISSNLMLSSVPMPLSDLQLSSPPMLAARVPPIFSEQSLGGIGVNSLEFGATQPNRELQLQLSPLPSAPPRSQLSPVRNLTSSEGHLVNQLMNDVAPVVGAY